MVRLVFIHAAARARLPDGGANGAVLLVVLTLLVLTMLITRLLFVFCACACPLLSSSATHAVL